MTTQNQTKQQNVHDYFSLVDKVHILSRYGLVNISAHAGTQPLKTRATGAERQLVWEGEGKWSSGQQGTCYVQRRACVVFVCVCVCVIRREKKSHGVRAPARTRPSARQRLSPPPPRHSPLILSSQQEKSTVRPGRSRYGLVEAVSVSGRGNAQCFFCFILNQSCDS